MKSLFRHLCALIYDGLITVSLFFLITVLIVISQNGTAVEPITRWYQGILIGVLYLYYAISYTFGGQTIGMKAWKLTLVSTQGKLTQKQLLARFILYIPTGVISLFCLKTPAALLTKWTKTRIISA